MVREVSLLANFHSNQCHSLRLSIAVAAARLLIYFTLKILGDLLEPRGSGPAVQGTEDKIATDASTEQNRSDPIESIITDAGPVEASDDRLCK